MRETSLIQLESWEAAIKSGFLISKKIGDPQPIEVATLLGWTEGHTTASENQNPGGTIRVGSRTFLAKRAGGVLRCAGAGALAPRPRGLHHPTPRSRARATRASHEDDAVQATIATTC